MRRSTAMTIGMILGGVILGAVVAVVLFSWESQTRAGRNQLLPSPTAIPASSLGPPPTGITPAIAAIPEPVGSPAPVPPLSSSPITGTQAAGTAAGEAAAGAAVFSTKCNSCHPNGNAGAGPGVRGGLPNYPDDALKQLIRTGQGRMPGFPANTLSENDLNALVVYLRSLK